MRGLYVIAFADADRFAFGQSVYRANPANSPHPNNRATVYDVGAGMSITPVSSVMAGCFT